ncbi:MAG: hypothetical protein WCJ95_18610 [Mariniphaga sp.]
MSLEKIDQLIEWLETTQQNRQYSLDDMKELLSIAMTELADENDKTFECLPQGHIDAIIELMKESGEYYRLDRQIESFKQRFKG